MSAQEDLNRLLQHRVFDADDLCGKCWKGPLNEMLCPGMRPIFDRENEKAYGSIRVVQESCAKLKEKHRRLRMQDLIDKSGIPNTYLLDKYKALPPPSTAFKQLPLAVCASYTNEFRESMWDRGIEAVTHGLSFRYVLMMALISKYTQWYNILNDFGESVDILYLDRYDVGTAPDFVIDYVAELLDYRVRSGLCTVVTLSSQIPKSRTPSEEGLYEAFKSWEKTI